MAVSIKKSNFSTGITSAAAIIVVLAGIKIAAPVVVPFLLAGFIALICSFPLFWLNRKGVPNGLSVVLVIFLLIIIALAMGAKVGTSINQFYENLPKYKTSLNKQSKDLVKIAEATGIDMGAGAKSIHKMLDASMAMDMAAILLKNISSLIANGSLILLAVIFILLEAVSLPLKLRTALDDPTASFKHFKQFLDSVKQYLIIKTVISIATGLTVGIWLWILNIDFPVLWGLLAFAFNFVPNIGSIIAAVPPLLLALVQFGPLSALWVGVCFLSVNTLFGSVVEPKIMGKGVGLSTLVVFVSLIFWGWLLGPVGMLLSVPLTMIVKIACERSSDLKFVAVLLGSVDESSDSSTPPLAE